MFWKIQKLGCDVNGVPYACGIDYIEAKSEFEAFALYREKNPNQEIGLIQVVLDPVSGSPA